jgi:large subunit ribosomal protein L19
MDAIRAVEASQLQQGRDEVSVGDTVRVHYRIVEGKTERIQVFEGLVIAMARESARATFKVRKISYGVGVERTFPLHSPRIQKIEVTRKGRVRRAKLFYIRDRVGKSAKVAELLRRKRTVAVPVDAPEAVGSAAESTAAELAGATPDKAAEKQQG